MSRAPFTGTKHSHMTPMFDRAPTRGNLGNRPFTIPDECASESPAKWRANKPARRGPAPALVFA